MKPQRIRNVYFTTGIDVWHAGVVQTLSVERHPFWIEQVEGGLLIGPTPVKLRAGETAMRTLVPMAQVKSIVFYPEDNTLAVAADRPPAGATATAPEAPHLPGIPPEPTNLPPQVVTNLRPVTKARS